MQFLAALLPVAIYLFVVYQIDNFSLLSIKRLLLLIVCGMLTALACFGLFTLHPSPFTLHLSPFTLHLSPFTLHLSPDTLHPIVEEVIKGIPLLILAVRKKIVFFIDSVICGAAVGGGFSILENLFYLLLGNEMGLGTVLFRGLEVSLIHMGCSAIVAAGLMLAVRMVERSRSRTDIQLTDILMVAFLLVVAPALHVFHNTFHFNPLLQFVFVFGTTGGLLLWTYLYDVDMIHRWLDTGLDKQISLLDSIKEGHLDETPTGVFLESVKESFPPEVYFDIICYVQLHVELAVAAKSRVMLREAGLDLPMADENKQLILSQYTEYKLLEKSLGKTARMTIAPVVKHSPADQKSLEDLRAECRQ